MHFSVLPVLLLASSSLTSASFLWRRALTPAKLLEELSNLQGRDWCQNYINAQVLVLPDYTTVYETKWISKSTISRTTSSSTETIGTLRKGTSTTTVNATGTAQWSTVTVPHTVYALTTITNTVTRSTTVTRPLAAEGDDEEAPTTQTPSQVTEAESARTPNPTYPDQTVRRRQLPSLLPVLGDSDPVSISAACTKVLNKYPVYVTSTAETTKSMTATTSTTIQSVIVKTIKVTQINPYLIRTTTVTVPGTTRTQTDTSVVEAVSTVQAATKTVTATSVAYTDYCSPSHLSSSYSNPQPYQIFVPISPDPKHAYETLTFSLDLTQCCRRCFNFKYTNNGGCLAYGWGEGNICEIAYNTIVDETVTNCPQRTLGIAINGGNQQPELPKMRNGPCKPLIAGCNSIDMEGKCWPEWAPYLDIAFNGAPADSIYK